MSLDILKQRVKSKQFGGLYLFFGADEYTKDYYASVYKKQAEANGFGDFNDVTFDGKSLTPAALSEALDAYPFMNDFKLITVKAADLNAKTDEKTAAAYDSIFASVPEYAAVIFFCRDGEYEQKPAKKNASGQTASSLAEIINARGLAVEFPVPDRFRISSWISKHFTARGTEIAPEAIDCMIMMCGTDLYILSGEIDKLCSAANGKRLTEEDVLFYCCANEEFQTFDLANAVTAGDCKRARKILDNLEASKTEPLMILGALSKNFSDMLIIKCGTEAGASPFEIANRLKTNEWAVNKRISSMRNKSVSFLKRAVKECKECDLKQKSFSVDAFLLLGTLAQKLSSMSNG